MSATIHVLEPLEDRAEAAAARPAPILQEGRNCWRVKTAERAAVLVDAEDYFAALEASLLKAERSILIAGWDFDGSIRLRPDPDAKPFGPFLRELVERRPELEIRILIWNLSTVHTPSAALPIIFGDDWQEHQHIALRLDHKHPLHGAQHQKIVCVDGRVAFVGGMDLTIERWDTSAHTAGDPRRITAEGKAYDPVHDLQMVVDGEAAAAVCDLARNRWRAVTGEDLGECAGSVDCWPSGVVPDFTATPVAIARTCPGWRHDPEVHEAATLNEDAVLAARKSIYIEAQYLANRSLVDLLCAQLRRPDGPEVVILVTRVCHSRLEQFIMGNNRDRMIRRLKQADRFGRFRAFYPVVPGPNGGDCHIVLHAKLVIVDDDFIRVGSSNLNNRSIALDTECDLAIEAQNETARRAIARIRERLIAEHVDASVHEVRAALAAHGSLVKAIDSLNTKRRGLRPYDHITEEGPTRSMIGTRFLDPRRPNLFLPKPRARRPRYQT